VAWRPGQGTLGLGLRRGAHVPAHASALGKMLLGTLGGVELRALLTGGPLAACAPATITGKRALAEEVARARAQGFALEREEHQPGVFGIAVPVSDRLGRPVAALGLFGRTPEITLGRLQGEMDPLRAAARSVGRRIADPDW
jgi:IclR family pca regulon transcriptional regulator